MDNKILFLLLVVQNVLSSPVALRLSIGSIVGKTVNISKVQAEIYNSIPYAHPPLHHLRLEYPVPLNKSSDRIDTNRRVQCLQIFSYDHAEEENEDCLYMKVVVPLDSRGNRFAERLPAVVWIHGGSYNEGSKEQYSDEGILKHFTSNKIVFMAMNYRLGVLGFLTALHADLPGNYGLEDQILALKVFVDHSVEFGVDKSKITIAGESAGAASAAILAVTPKTKGLITSLMAISGSSLATWAVRSHSTEIMSAHIIRQCNCTNDSVDSMRFCMKTLKSLDCAEQAFQYLENSLATSWYEVARMGASILTPVVDVYRLEDSILPNRIEHLVKETARIPALFSVTRNERGSVPLFEALTRLSLKNSSSETKLQKLEQMVDSLISWNVKSRKYVIQAIHKMYLKSELSLTNKTFLELSDLLTRDMTASSYEEALFYARRNNKVFAFETHSHDDEDTHHGHDTSALFMTHELGNGCEKCPNLTDFATHFSSVLCQFITNRSITNMYSFSNIHRNAYQVTRNGSKSIDWHTDDYYFWRHTIPLLENLLIYPTSPIHMNDCPPWMEKDHLVVGLFVVLSLLLLLLPLCWMCRRKSQKKTLFLKPLSNTD